MKFKSQDMSGLLFPEINETKRHERGVSFERSVVGSYATKQTPGKTPGTTPGSTPGYFSTPAG